MKNARGFTLLEMLVATTIMAIAVVALLAGIAGATRNAARLRDYDRAVELARFQMSELLLDQRLPRDSVVNGEFDPALTSGIDAGWQARISTFQTPPSPGPNQMALDRIELQIWWMSGPTRRTFTLDGYRPRLMK